MNGQTLRGHPTMGADRRGGSGGSDFNPRLSWWEQRRARAEYLLNGTLPTDIQVDNPLPYNYAVTPPVAAGASPPTVNVDLGRSSGISFKFAGAGFGQLFDAPITGAQLISSPKTEAWYYARKVAFLAALTGGTYTIPLSLDNGTSTINVNVQFAIDPVQFFLQLNAGGGAVNYNLGSLARLGTTVPLIAPVTLAYLFNLRTGRLSVEIEDQEVFAVTNDVPVGGLNAMPTAALQWNAQASSAGLLVSYGSFVMVKTGLF